MKPTNVAYLLHIRDAVKEVLDYASAHTYAQFIENTWDQAAVIRHLEIIGEAAAQVSPDLKESNPQIPWRRISYFRKIEKLKKTA